MELLATMDWPGALVIIVGISAALLALLATPICTLIALFIMVWGERGATPKKENVSHEEVP